MKANSFLFASSLFRAIPLLCLLLLVSRNLVAQPDIESVYPTLGRLGEELSITANGSGFDANTRITLALDGGNARFLKETITGLGQITTADIHDAKAYIATGDGQFAVIDISDISAPTVLAFVDGDVVFYREMRVYGNSAFLLTDDGLESFDISDPTDPQKISTVDLGDYPHDLEVTDNYAVVSVGSDQIRIYDVSVPSSPELVASVEDVVGNRQLDLEESVLYSAGVIGLNIFDFLDPTEPTKLSSLDLTFNQATEWISSMAVENGIVYMVGNVAGFQIVDANDRSSPQRVGRTGSSVFAEDLWIEDDIVYVARRELGIQVVDVSDITVPETIGIIDTNANAQTIEVVGDLGFVVDRLRGLQIIDASGRAQQTLIGSVNHYTQVRDIALSGSLALVASLNYGMEVFNIDEPANPTAIGSYRPELYYYVESVGVFDDIVYVSSLEEVVLLEVSPSGTVNVLSSIAVSKPYDVQVENGIAYIASFDGALLVADVSDPASPVLLGSVDTPGNSWDLVLQNNHIFLADYVEGLQVIDVSDPALPTLVANYATYQYAHNVAVKDSHVLVSKWYGVDILDVTNPSNPLLVGQIETIGGAFGIEIVNDTAYISGDVEGVYVVDISDITKPLITGIVDSPGSALHSQVDGDKVYVADSTAGLSILPLPIEIEEINFNATDELELTIPAQSLEGNYTLRVFDGSGYRDRKSVV